MNDEWKELGPDEVIQDGDEFQSGSGWDPAFSAIGQSVRTSGLTVRRRVSPEKEAVAVPSGDKDCKNPLWDGPLCTHGAVLGTCGICAMQAKGESHA